MAKKPKARPSIDPPPVFTWKVTGPDGQTRTVTANEVDPWEGTLTFRRRLSVGVKDSESVVLRAFPPSAWVEVELVEEPSSTTM